MLIIHYTNNYSLVFCGISALLLVGIFFVFGIYHANRRQLASSPSHPRHK